MVKNPPASAGDMREAGSIPELGRFPGGGALQPTLVFLPEETLWTEEPDGLHTIHGVAEPDTTEAT